MQTLIVKTDSVAHAKFLSSFLKTVGFVKSVFIEPNAVSTHIVSEPAVEYNWTNPSRPATDEEIDQLIIEMENDGPGEDVEIVFNRIKKGLKKRS